MTRVSLEAFVRAARAGELVSFPTDTIPALAARGDRAGLIFDAKQRPPNKPLILMAARSEDLWPYVAGSEGERQIWQQTADRYWPGALTLVLPASDRVPSAMNPTDPTTIGVRVPNSEVARTVLTQTGPLATTSANRSGEAPLRTTEAIEAQFPRVYLLPSELTANASSGGVPSTVAKWTGQDWEILRQGAVRLAPLTTQ